MKKIFIYIGIDVCFMEIILTIYIKHHNDKEFQLDSHIHYIIANGFFSSIDEIRDAIGHKVSNIICNNLDFDFYFETHSILEVVDNGH